MKKNLHMNLSKLTPFSRPYKNLIGIGDRIHNPYVYKYMTIKSAEKCLQTNTILFQWPSNWKDPFEKLYYTADYTKVMPTPPINLQLFACCFTLKQKCEAAWQMYSDTGDPCIRFKIHIGQFRRYLDQYVSEKSGVAFEGLVNYYNKKDILRLYKKSNCNYNKFFNDFNLEKYLNLILLKREDYKYEEEIRYIIQIPTIIGAEKSIPIPWSHCLKEVTLSPYLVSTPDIQKQIHDRLREALDTNYRLGQKKYPTIGHYRININQDTLYQPIPPIIIE